ncbi:MAG: dTDP-4-dehydrorhamnose 3,5-epimerase [Rhodospirillaceae bacterium]|nr:dTDP-4-dehydrorhamnose 3,5-epimerase [Rhodospirillaceae bacterium]MDD9929046.1 dTDP-4-dehydrorhamnose 3,5-epimerase [Rhodospirillaceae bacterium]
MRTTETVLPGVLLVEPDVLGDERGFFQEIWNREKYAEAGIPGTFVQDNMSRSSKGVVRGLHYQEPGAQGKLVQVIAGAVFDVAVDIRRGSETFGRWVGEVLSAENHRQLWVPPGFAHGFCVVSDTADFFYKCTTPYRPMNEHVIRFDDPDIGIDWPVDAPRLSERDQNAPLLRDTPVLPDLVSS